MQQKTLLIPYAHWHPANLAGVHRPRLIGNFLKEFGWKTIVVTVEEKYFEETPDRDFVKTFSEDVEVYRVKAYKITKPRLIGDIGLRAFFQMKKKCLEIIRTQQIDFIWIPIPSFYSALLGPALYTKTKVPYGIDYIDPWVRDISKNPDLRAKLSLKIAKYLEPKAVKHASLITGVSFEYFKPMLNRNFDSKLPSLRGTTRRSNLTPNNYPLTASFPYGFDPHDHQITLQNLTYPWQGHPGCKHILYAGAFLPNSIFYMELFFKVIRGLKEENRLPENIRFYFVGTGHYKHKSIQKIAKENNIENIVTEIRDRFPFLQVLNFLSAAYRILVLGTTEKHYTASKIFQSILSKRPVMAVFHHESTVNNIMDETNTKKYLIKYTPGMKEEELQNKMEETFMAYIKEDIQWKPDYKALDKYSAREGARVLAEKMNEIIS